MTIKTAMTIGGFDPSAGAGIQADLKTFAALGIHGVTILTSNTMQNTRTVDRLIPIHSEDIQHQIEIVTEDIPIKHVKTGLLYNSSIVNIVASATKINNWILIVDPVLSATSGDSLTSTDLLEEIKKTLIPLSTITTPNIPEAEALSQTSIESVDDMKQAAKTIYNCGAENVVLKGGHLKNKRAIDIFYDGKQYTEVSLPRIPNKKAHGSGCTFSALLTGYLTKGNSTQLAFSQAKYAVWNMIYNGYNIGKGSDVLCITSQTLHQAPQNITTSTQMDTWMKLSSIVPKIIAKLPLSFIPEVGVNIGFAIPEARTKNDICAIDGRIVGLSEKPIQSGPLRFGSSDHIASIILEAMKTYPFSRSVMNIKYTPENLSYCKKTNYHISSFNRANEPNTVSSTMEWGTKTAIGKIDTYPDFIYDTGSIGKEPMIRILGRNPKDVYTKLSTLIKHRKNQ